MQKGLFITFEGIEGCGKTTQAKLLQKALQSSGYEVLRSREPGGPAISEEIRKLLLNPQHKEMLPETEMLLYMASRSQHTGEWIIPALEEEKIVICDRYFDSTLAYQGAARNVNLSIIETITYFATFNLTPQLTFLLDLEVEKGMDRINNRQFDRLEQETREFHEKVRKQYLSIAKKYSFRYFVLNGEQPRDIIHEQVLAQVVHYISKKHPLLRKER